MSSQLWNYRGGMAHDDTVEEESLERFSFRFFDGKCARSQPQGATGGQEVTLLHIFSIQSQFTVQ